MSPYAAEVVDGVITQVIVGDAAWAAESLGGTWVPLDAKAGVGWTWDGAAAVPPVVDLPEGVIG
jgi:hypothetical protein